MDIGLIFKRSEYEGVSKNNSSVGLIVAPLFGFAGSYGDV